MAARDNPPSDRLQDVVAAAKSLVPLILASRDEGEQIRRVPPLVAKALAAAGLLQMFLPRSMGGPELDPLTVFHAIEEISKADGSIGWCAMIATDASLFMGWMSPEIGRQFCGRPADFRGAGSIRPLGRAYPVDGGYRIQGHFNFASGIDHANRLYCPCFIMDARSRDGMHIVLLQVVGDHAQHHRVVLDDKDARRPIVGRAQVGLAKCLGSVSTASVGIRGDRPAGGQTHNPPGPVRVHTVRSPARRPCPAA